jgi:hypothetical protein
MVEDCMELLSLANMNRRAAFELKGVKPSVANPTCTFRGSLAKLGS